MAISEELKVIYSSNTRGATLYDTIELSHSLFTSNIYMINANQTKQFRDSDGVLQDFQPFGFRVELPKAGDAQQDLSFVFDNVNRLGIREVEKASQNINEPIVLIFRTYIDGIDTPQNEISLLITDITATYSTISAKASRPNLYKKYFPYGNKTLFDRRFAGLK